LAVVTLSGCYVVNFFKRKGHTNSGDTLTGTVIGVPLGARAGGLDEAALAVVDAASTTHAPAAIRPDPDLYVRTLLRQYRPEDVTLAHQIGEVDKFSLLLGGASQDFATPPQEAYDATSLLAVEKVSDEVCRGLVAPDAWEHPGWKTVLPFAADQEAENIAWLAQRITGRPSAAVAPEMLSQLAAIMSSEEPFVTQNDWAKGNAYAKYVPVCAALAMSADALYF